MKIWERLGGKSLAVIVAAATMFAFGVSKQASAQGSEVGTYTVSVEVDNSFDLAETTQLSFGTISALADATDTATLTLNGQTGATSITDAGNAALIVITAGTPGVISVSGAPPTTPMDVTGLVVNGTLGNPATTGEATFTAALNATGPGYCSASCNTDASGNLTVRIGGTLTTEATANSYTDGTYTGTYTLTVTF